MSAFDDAERLLEHASDEIPKIQAAYESSLHDKKVKSALLVEIKNFLENLRSALDFSARGLFERYGCATKSKLNVYFPYALGKEDRAAFVADKRVEKKIPGLSASRPDIVLLLTEMQHFGNLAQPWLPAFMALNNENKHERLTPQHRQESQEIRVTSGAAAISMSGGAAISIGRGASISFGEAHIPGGQIITAGSAPIVLGNAKVENITWVSFTFETNGEQVLPFLKKALDGTKTIVASLKEQ